MVGWIKRSGSTFALAKLDLAKFALAKMVDPLRLIHPTFYLTGYPLFLPQ